MVITQLFTRTKSSVNQGVGVTPNDSHIEINIRLFSLNEPTVHNTPCIVLGLKEKSSTSKKSWLVSSVVFYNDRTLKLRRETFEKRIRKTARLLWQNNVFFLSLCFSIGVIVCECELGFSSVCYLAFFIIPGWSLSGGLGIR